MHVQPLHHKHSQQSDLPMVASNKQRTCNVFGFRMLTPNLRVEEPYTTQACLWFLNCMHTRKIAACCAIRPCILHLCFVTAAWWCQNSHLTPPRHTVPPPYLYTQSCSVLLLLVMALKGKPAETVACFQRLSAGLSNVLLACKMYVLPKSTLNCCSSCMLNKRGSPQWDSQAGS